MQNKIRLKRLEQLKYMLENHDKLFETVKFDLNHWGLDKKSCEEEDVCLKGKCNSAACALGSAGLYPPFRKAGLKTDVKDNEVRFGYEEGFMAGSEFFGLGESESGYLFDPDQYRGKNISALTVAKRVDALIGKYSLI